MTQGTLLLAVEDLHAPDIDALLTPAGPPEVLPPAGWFARRSHVRYRRVLDRSKAWSLVRHGWFVVGVKDTEDGAEYRLMLREGRPVARVLAERILVGLALVSPALAAGVAVQG